MRTVIFDAFNILSLVVSSSTSPQIQVYKPSTFFPTSKRIARTGSVFVLNPKMDHVRSVDYSGGFMTFARPLNFLDFQSIFDLVYSSNPFMTPLPK